MKQPVKFKMGNKPKPNSKEKSSDSNINVWALAFFAISVAIIATITVRYAKVYGSWKANWDVIAFAKENPELVRNVKTQYDNGIKELKLELVSPKELSQ